MPIYSEKVMTISPIRGMSGRLENADGIGEVGNPVCGI